METTGLEKLLGSVALLQICTCPAPGLVVKVDAAVSTLVITLFPGMPLPVTTIPTAGVCAVFMLVMILLPEVVIAPWSVKVRVSELCVVVAAFEIVICVVLLTAVT